MAELITLPRALKLELEALETSRKATQDKFGDISFMAQSSQKTAVAITALKAALAEDALQRLTDVHQEIEAALEQPEQEPVAWMRNDGLKAMPADEKTAWAEADLCHLISDYTIPLFTHPPRREWQELTREGINQMMSAVGWQNAAIRQADLDKVEKVVRAVEARLKELNT
jgi:hypothetical protein